MNISINIKVSKPHVWYTELAQCEDVDRLKSFATFALSGVKRSTREIRNAENACRRAEDFVYLRHAVLQLCKEVEDEFKEMEFWGDLSVPRQTDLHKKWAEWWGPVAEASKWVKKPESIYSVKFSETEQIYKGLCYAVEDAFRLSIVRMPNAYEVCRDGVPILHIKRGDTYYHPGVTYAEMNQVGTNFPAFRGIKRKETPP